MSLVKTAGIKFTLDGQIWFPFGGAIYGSTNTTADYKSRVDEAVTYNFTMLRLINYFNGSDYSNATVWARVDYFLDYANTNGIKVLVDLSDYCGYLIGQGITPSNQDWTAFLSFLLNRVNTVNGKTYKNDDTIAMFSIAGELNGTYNSETVTFYTNVSQLIKQTYGASQLVNTGGLDLSKPITSILAIPTIDCYCAHDYSEPIDSDFSQWYGYAAVANKPWFMEEFGQQSLNGDIKFAAWMRRFYQKGLKWNIAGFMFWNFYPSNTTLGGGTDYNIGPGGGLPLTNKMVKLYSYIKSYPFRIPVDAAINAGWS